MCGIVGLFHANGAPLAPNDLLAMATAIHHRGPDDVGYLLGAAATGAFRLLGGAETPADVLGYPLPYAPAHRIETAISDDTPYTLGLANRRLAIVDLSPAGHQPLCNEDGRLWIVYNGELYNASELRAELAAAGHHFFSGSDTEVIVHACEQWGDECVARFNGMWAFALWDRSAHRLFLSRDRVGIKPLYYCRWGDRFAFASEIKALLALGMPRRANAAAMADFLLAGLTDHTPQTFFDGIFSLPPAHNLVLDLVTGEATTRPYWQIDPARTMHYRDDAAYAAAFRDLFEDAVRVHLISDVAVGTCLSGGLDSSAVVCAINRLTRERGVHVVGMEARQKTFSARYTDPHHDEGRFIDAVVAGSAVDAYTVYPSPEELKANWYELVYHLEEPFGSTSMFAQWSVFRLARQTGVTVTLDGQGGDELLAGYLGFFPFYLADLAASLRWPRLWAEFRHHCVLHDVSPRREARNIASNLLPDWLRLRLRGQVAAGQAWLGPEIVAAGQATASQRWQGARVDRPLGRTRLERGLHEALMVNPLPSLLRFDDRNSMAHSIESRVPFLDYRLIEFCLALPPEQKIRGGVTKHILRQAMKDVLPEPIRQRHDKIGFSTPQDRWLREALAPWLAEVFHSPEFRSRPEFRAEEVLHLLARHQAGAGDQAQALWRCLVVELWRRAMQVDS